MIDKYIENTQKRKDTLSEYLELKLIYGDYKYFFTDDGCLKINDKYYNIFDDLDNNKFIIVTNKDYVKGEHYSSSYNIFPKIIIDDMTEIIKEINDLFNFVRCIGESKIGDIETRWNKDGILCYIGNDFINQLLLNTDIGIKKLEDGYLLYKK